MGLTYKLSTDYDGTLSRKSVQEYIKSLVELGHEVWITTSRYDSVDKYPTEEVQLWKINNLEKEWNNLFLVADKVGINREHIIFTNKESKVSYIQEQKFLWHLDDDWIELNRINDSTKTIGISVVGQENWIEKCNKLLNNELSSNKE